MAGLTEMAGMLLANNLLTSSSSNSGSSSTQQLIERFVPGFGHIHALILRFTGIDATLSLTSIMLVIGASKVIKAFINKIDQFLVTQFMSAVVVPAYDRANSEVIRYQAAHHVADRGVRFLTAKSKGTATQNDPITRLYGLNRTQTVVDDRSPPLSFFPRVGRHWFWFRGRPFIFEHGSEHGLSSSFDTDLNITIRCLGWNPQPVKDYLLACKEFVQQESKNMTKIYQNGVGGYVWKGPQLVPTRPLDTVEMDQNVKEDLLDDISHYLRPETQDYYTNNGIPYRRGYLFYGPPGTGKSSFCRALAGHFDLELYMMSLSSDVNVVYLRQCFSALPSKCLVLLEDIDAAGIGRPKQKGKEFESPENENQANSGQSEKGITFSDLLNTLDGSAAQEGRIVVMTTNCPEELDKALIRAGRIDKQVPFPEMNRQVAGRIFKRMFQASGLTKEELEKNAQALLAKLPEKAITPAELQGYLLDCRGSPIKAAEQIDSWITGLMEAKEAGRNIVVPPEKPEANESSSEASPNTLLNDEDDEIPFEPI